jgi:hypothetical protein
MSFSLDFSTQKDYRSTALESSKENLHFLDIEVYSVTFIQRAQSFGPLSFQSCLTYLYSTVERPTWLGLDLKKPEN